MARAALAAGLLLGVWSLWQTSSTQQDFVAPLAPRQSVAAQAHGSSARSLSAVALSAEGKDITRSRVQRMRETWVQPFPKYTVGGCIFFGLIGFIGGGPQLCFVFGLSGAGFGSLFEPWITPEGRISGLYDED